MPGAPADLAAQAHCGSTATLRQQLKIGGPALLEGEDRRHVITQAEDLGAVEPNIACSAPQGSDGGPRLQGVDPPWAAPRTSAPRRPARWIQQRLRQGLGRRPDLELDSAPPSDG
eukprot:1813240-Pyramimonas_sp.AAC.1